jgi:hypothetical protein
MGYDIVKRDGKKEFVINKKGKLLGKGFQWKTEGVSNEEVCSRLAAHGLKLSNQRISDLIMPQNSLPHGILADMQKNRSCNFPCFRKGFYIIAKMMNVEPRVGMKCLAK